MALSANLQRSTYAQDLAGETQYKRSIDQYNKANPNSQINYEPTANYNTPSAVRPDNSGTFIAGAGSATFGTKNEAQNYATSGGGQISGQPMVQQTNPVAPNQPVQQPQRVEDPLVAAARLEQEARTNQTGLIEKGMQDLTKLGKDFGLETEPDTIQGMVDKFKAKQLQEKTYAEQQNARQAALDQAEAARFEAKAAGAQGATAAQFAQGREGAMAGSAPKLSSEFAVEMKKQIDENRIRLEAAQAQRDNMMLQLEQAQKNGQSGLVEQISKQLGAAEERIQRTKTNYLNALSQQNQDTMAREQQKATITNMGIDQAGSMADYGALTLEAAQAIAVQTGLPIEGLLGLVEASQLKGEERTVAVAQKKQDLADQVAGLAGAQGQKIRYFTDQSKQINQNPNLTPEQKSQRISELSMNLGIDSADNPITQADLNYKNAQLKYQNSATAKNYQDLLIAQAEYDSIYGSDALVPNGKYTASAYTTEDGQPAVKIGVKDGQSLDIPGTDRREDWCAAFTNDALGTSFGDLFTDKMKLVNSKVPAAGMAFVEETSEPWGHVGIVESVDLANGKMSVVEANWQKGSDGKGIVSRRTMDISDANGFVKPKGSTSINASTVDKVKRMSNADIYKAYENAGKILTTDKDKAAAIRAARNDGYIPGGQGNDNTAIPKEERSKLQNDPSVKKVKAANEFNLALKAYGDLVKGVDDLQKWGENKTRLDSAYSNLKVQFKNAAELGAIAAADIPLIEGSIKPMTKDIWDITGQAQYAASGGKEGVLGSLEEATKLSNERKQQAVDELTSLYPEYLNTDYFQTLIGKDAGITENKAAPQPKNWWDKVGEILNNNFNKPSGKSDNPWDAIDTTAPDQLLTQFDN